MASNWNEVKIGDAALRVTKGTTPTTVGGRFTDAGIGFVKVESITEDGQIDPKKLAFIDEEANQLLSRSMLQENDVLFTIAGTIGRVALVDDDLLPANTNQAVAIIRPDQEVIDPRFLYYSLRDKERVRLARTRVVQSVQANFSLAELRSMAVSLPPLAEQRAIAHILGTLDDKIELNRQMNRTLDEIARTLFTSWFVNFDPVRAKAEGRQPEGMDAETAVLFPDRFVDSELGPIPEGWEVKTLGDIAEFNRSTVKPFEHPNETFAHHSLPAFDAGRTPDLTLGASIKSTKTLVPTSAVLLSKLNPHIQRVWMPSIWSAQEATPVASTEFFVLIARNGVPRSFVMALVSSSAFQRQFATLATGTSNSHQRVRPNDAKQLAHAVPAATVLAAFNTRVEPLYRLILDNRAESQTLAKMRETLLPELLSGRAPLVDPLVARRARS